MMVVYWLHLMTKIFLEQVVEKYLFLDGNGNYKISLDWKVFQMKPKNN